QAIPRSICAAHETVPGFHRRYAHRLSHVWCEGSEPALRHHGQCKLRAQLLGEAGVRPGEWGALDAHEIAGTGRLYRSRKGIGAHGRDWENKLDLFRL